MSDAETQEILDVAHAIARRYHKQPWVFLNGVTREDLEQVAALGALRGRTVFDPNRGPYHQCLYVYAAGEVRHWLREHLSLIRIPRDLYSGKDGKRHDVIVRSLDFDAFEDKDYGDGSPPPALWATVTDHGIDRMYLRADVRDAVRRLPKQLRRIVFLYYFCDLNQTEVARRVGITQKSVSRCLHRAYTYLQDAVPA